MPRLNSRTRLVVQRPPPASAEPAPYVTEMVADRADPCGYFLLFLRNSTRVYGPDSSMGRSLFLTRKGFRAGTASALKLTADAFRAHPEATRICIKFRRTAPDVVDLSCVPLTDQEYDEDFLGKHLLQDIGELRA